MLKPTDYKQDGYLLSQIYLRYQVPSDLGEFFGLGEYYKTLNAKMILDAALTYLNMDNYVKVTLLPEKGTDTRPIEADRENIPASRHRPAA